MRRDQRTSPRFFLNPPVPGLANNRVAKVIDLSAKGARLEVIEPFQPGEPVYLVIATKSNEITVPGNVLWCELESMLVDMIHDRYIVGVAFDHPSNSVSTLIDRLLDQGAALRIEDFRNFDRYRLITPLTASFGEGTPVSLLDLSIRGARILSTQSFGVGVGEQLRFRADGDVVVVARVMWSSRSNVPDMFNTGLLITGQDEIMRAAIHRLCMKGDARIDMDSLKRKFDGLRAKARRREDPSTPLRDEEPAVTDKDNSRAATVNG